ncbi:MAG: putative O-glycosylation ligase, exosortase A system-associated [Geminicoccaceae bacterium]|nr:putative O-glycosylation ligase, exosortase A system-associated [Geminicoccaceae bacterium]
MRDLLLSFLVGGLLAAALVRPHWGLFGYVWVSLMAPHRLTYGFAQEMPWAQMLALVTLARWLVSDERKLPLAWSPLHPLLALFAAQWAASTAAAWAPDLAFDKFVDALKLLVGFYLITVLIDRPERLRALVWIVALSVGFYGLKGGIFVLATGGAHQVLGPYPSLMADNNGIALALVMVLPLFLFLYETSRGFWLRAGLACAVGLVTIAVLGTWSRGGLLALAATALVAWWHSRARVPLAVLGASAALLLALVLPESWFAKMATIDDFDRDASAQLRFTAWEYAWNVALARPLLGGGFRVFVLNNIRHGAGGHSEYLNAHSIYFEVLGELGFPGLFLLSAVLVAAFLLAERLRRGARERPDLVELARLGAALQASLAGYAVGGALLNMAFFELFYHLLALASVGAALARTAPAAAPVESVRAIDRREFARELLAGTWRGAAERKVRLR